MFILSRFYELGPRGNCTYCNRLATEVSDTRDGRVQNLSLSAGSAPVRRDLIFDKSYECSVKKLININKKVIN